MIPDSVRAITDPVDATLAAIEASLTRIEAKRADEAQDMLQVIAGLIESDPAWRYAIVALACD